MLEILLIDSQMDRRIDETLITMTNQKRREFFIQFISSHRLKGIEIEWR
jgi:hypothetical protein